MNKSKLVGLDGTSASSNKNLMTPIQKKGLKMLGIGGGAMATAAPSGGTNSKLPPMNPRSSKGFGDSASKTNGAMDNNPYGLSSTAKKRPNLMDSRASMGSSLGMGATDQSMPSLPAQGGTGNKNACKSCGR